jgi:hypothetical protein
MRGKDASRSSTVSHTPGPPSQGTSGPGHAPAAGRAALLTLAGQACLHGLRHRQLRGYSCVLLTEQPQLHGLVLLPLLLWPTAAWT